MEGRRVRGCSGSAGCRPSRRSIRQPLLRRPRSQRLSPFSPQVPEEQQQGDRLKRHLSGGAPRCGIPPPTPSHRSQSTPSRMEPCTHGSLKIPCSVKAGSQPDCWLSPWTSSVLGYHQHLDLPLPVQKEVQSRLWSSDAISCFCQLPEAIRLNTFGVAGSPLNSHLQHAARNHCLSDVAQ
ncbi:hypothetical protein VPH35_104822 [Triticum aestivum]